MSNAVTDMQVAFVENASGPAIALLVDPDENQLFVTLEQTVQIFNLSDLNKTTASRLGQRSRTTSASEVTNLIRFAD